jgi:ABC-type transporter Mla subunit MlaD
MDNMISSYDQITESISSAADAMEGWVEELNNDFDKLTSKLEHLNNVISSFSNIVELIGPSSLGMTD